jgi:formylglycine-generating enzyme required for sulfatase activity
MSKHLIIILGFAAAGATALVLSSRNHCDGTPPLCEVPGGTARLGSREPGGMPHHEACFTAFRMGAREITCGEFAQFRDEEPWRSAPPCHPATHISVDDALAYCSWLGRMIHARVRLPGEDEWEYAARGGIRGATFPWGWDAPGKRANFNARSVTPVAQFPANPFGLFDCAGNVAEWCSPPSPTSAVAIARGGSFADREEGRLNVFRRVEFPRNYRDADVGFRILVEGI